MESPLKRPKNKNLKGFENLKELVKIKILGEGTFGRVYLVEAKRSKYASHYALKVQQKHVIDELKQKKNIMNEKKIMELLDHPFILRLEGK